MKEQKTNVGKMIMISQEQRDMLVDIDDVFVSHLFTYGIQFDCDFWGILPNNIQDISRCLNPDIDWDIERIEKALLTLEKLGLIQFFGKNNFLIYVVDFGMNNYIDTLKLNFRVHNKKPKYEREMMIAIANGELHPTIMELPAISKKGGQKSIFVQKYNNREFKGDEVLKLFYPDLYCGINKYAKDSTDTDRDLENKHQVNNSNKLETESKSESKPISVPITESKPESSSIIDSNKESNIDIDSTKENGIHNEKEYSNDDLPF